METYLNVYEAWLEAGKNTDWCTAMCVPAATLRAADELLRKVHRAMERIKMPTRTFSGPRTGGDRSEVIMRSLAVGFFTQTAIASDLGNARKSFWLAEDYDIKPTSADLHMGCVLRSMANVQHVIYLQRSARADGSSMLSCVGRVEPEWLIEAATSNLAAAAMRRALQTMERTTLCVPDNIAKVGPLLRLAPSC
jgi:hypothetical protein